MTAFVVLVGGAFGFVGWYAKASYFVGLNGDHVAIFRTYDGEVYALGDIDPFSGASVLSRGIVGTRSGVPVITSPMFKQVFDLATGACLDNAGVQVPTYRVRVVDSIVLIGRP